MEFDRVTRLSVPEEIIESVKEKILNGDLNPGDRLPSESRLAEMFGVGRGTIREAMKVMIYLGLIRRTVNRTTFISDNARERVHLRSVLEKFQGHRDALEMIEVRKIIEPEAAALAAERCEKAMVEQLEQEYQLMDESAGNVESFAEHDNQFHTCIFNGTGNRLIMELMQSIHAAMESSQASVLSGSTQISPRSLRFHREILEAIKKGDTHTARKIMRSHILDVEKEMHLIYEKE